MKLKSICLDARMINSSGIGTYLHGLLDGLRSAHWMESNVCILGDPAALPDGPWTKVRLRSPIYSVSEQAEVPIAVRWANATLLHSPHYNLPFAMASKSIVTVHDLIHLKFPQYWPSLTARLYARFFFFHVVPKAKFILTVSENTKRDLIELLNIPSNRIAVTYPGVDHHRFTSISSPAQAQFDQIHLTKPYLLYVGNLKEFKNVQRLIEAYRIVRSRRMDIPDLVMVGRNFIPGFDQTVQQTQGVRWLGEVHYEVLPALYRNALAFLFPSLYEGFGLPPLEAMASGTPVLCSNRGSLPEVAGNAALFVDPENVDAITDGIERMVDDQLLRQDLIAKGLIQSRLFSWQRMTNDTLKLYKSCLA